MLYFINSVFIGPPSPFGLQKYQHEETLVLLVNLQDVAGLV